MKAILSATLAELREVGYPALTMDAVARRAGAGKASLYRRWSSRSALVMDAVYTLAPVPADLPDTGSLRDDLLAALRVTAATLQGPAGDALRGLLAEALPDRQRTEQLRGLSRGRNRDLMAEVLRRAVERGELAASAMRPVRLDVGAALLRQRFLFQGGPIDEGLITAVVDDVLLPMLGAAGPA